MPITIRKIELFCSLLFSLLHLSNVPKMPVFLSFFPKNRHFEMGSNCDVLTLKRTSFSTFFVVGRSNHLPTTSAFFRQIPSVSIYTKKLEMSCSQKEPRVRIPNSPPKTQSYQGFCPYDWAFLFPQGHIGVHDFRQELRCASRSALCPAESGYCPLHLPR